MRLLRLGHGKGDAVVARRRSLVLARSVEWAFNRSATGGLLEERPDARQRAPRGFRGG